MRFMNSYEIEDAQQRWASHPVLGPATQTLANLMDWTNRNSDGWAYWPKPTRAAAKLMELIQGDGTYQFMVGERADATPAKLKAALTPIKAFRTRQKGADFKIVEELPPPLPPKPPTHELVGKTIGAVTERQMRARDLHYKDTVSMTEVTFHFTDGTTHSLLLDDTDYDASTLRAADADTEEDEEG